MILGVWNYHEILHKNNYMLTNLTEDCLGEDSMLSFYEFTKEAKKQGHQVEIITNNRNFDEYDAFIFINFPKRSNKLVNDALNSKKPKYLINPST